MVPNALTGEYKQVRRAASADSVPDSAFLLPEQRLFPVKIREDGEWVYSDRLLAAADRRARESKRQDISAVIADIRASMDGSALILLSDISAARMRIASGPEEYGDVDDHPNRSPFKAVLHQVDTPSTRAPSGSEGKKVQISASVARKRLRSLLGMGLDVDARLGGHNARYKIGVITAAGIGHDPAPDMKVKLGPIAPNDVVIAGHLFTKDFPDEVRELRASAARGELGASYEISAVQVHDRHAQVWNIDDYVYTGAAALLRSAAAYENTSLAASAQDAGEVGKMTRAELAAELGSMEKRIMAEVSTKVSEAVATKVIEAMSGEEDSEEYGEDMKMAREKEKEAMSLEESATDEEHEMMKAAAAAGDDVQAGTDGIKSIEKKRADARGLRFEAAALRVKKEFRPVIHAMSGLITDSECRLGKLLTDTVAGKGAAKLVTDPTPPKTGANQGGPARRTISAAANAMLTKHEETGPKAAMRERDFDTIAASQGIPPEKRIAMKIEMQQNGLLVG